MNAFELISANNGWVMAMTGIAIVMSGLAGLSLIISQLHRVVALFDKQKETVAPPPSPPPQDLPGTVDLSTAQYDILDDPAAAARIFQPVTTGLGQTFHLQSLYEFFKKENIAHPHLTIRTLREADYLVQAEDETFTWNMEKL